MRNLIKEQFEGGKIWEHDIQSANEMVAKYIRSLGGNEWMVEDILDLIHHGQLDEWDGEKILRMIDDYIDR